MNNLLETMQRIIPNGINDLIRRYEIIKGIESNQPIGRRSLSTKLKISEKILRNDINFLKSNEYINVSSLGMSITNSGKMLSKDLDNIVHDFKGLVDIENKIKSIFNGIKIVVVAGNCDEDKSVKASIGKIASKVLIDYLSNGTIVALTGGSTVAQMVRQCVSCTSSNLKYKDVLVVPARGGLGNNVEYQANTLASKLAKKVGASYKLLNVPDNLSRKAMESIQKEPEIKDIISNLLKANILIFGIGDAVKMASRRHLTDTLIDFLKRKNAVAEAFGYYFDEIGNTVYSSKTIGVKIDLLKTLPVTIALAGGKSKAKAILALRKHLKKGCLVIDEGAALEMIRLYQLNS